MKIFDQASAGRRPKKNKFDLSHERKMTMNMGGLYPCLMLEVIPGDSFRVQSQIFLRFLALVAPVMHRVDVSLHYFFVPNRLLWANWPNFITGGETGLLAPAFPTFKVGDANTANPVFLKNGQLLDYLGFPTMKTTDAMNAGYANNQFSVLPVRAYQLIYDQYYRDQNVEPSNLPPGFLNDGLIPGADYNSQFAIRQRAWEKDYFTSCLPFTQRGTAVSVPVSVGAPTGGVSGANVPLWRLAATGVVAPIGATPFQVNAGTGGQTNIAAAGPYYFDPNGSLTSSSITINALRASVRLQEWLEKNARGGGRYIEQILAHFGVLSSDARLQRVEYLGGGRQPVVVSEVLQTSTPAGGTPLATMAGHGVSVGSSNRFSKFFEEHGFIMGLISVLPRTAYQEFIPPHFWRQVNTDFFFPEFAHLGEQTVIQQQVYYNMADAATSGTGGNVFGYQSRFAEYKYIPTQTSSQLKETLGYWTLTRVFGTGNVPSLNTAFVQCVPRQDIFATPADINHLIAQIMHTVDAIRPMPYFGTPQL